MSKLILIPNSMKMIYDTLSKVDGYIIGIEGLSVNLPITFNIVEVINIINLLNKNKKDIFISLNKNMHNKDLPFLKEVLIKLESYKITGIMYYDISIVNLKNKLDLKNDLVWSQEHLTTNKYTMDYWYSKGAIYTYVSSEITKREINEMMNSKSSLLINVFGYLPIFTSRRHLVDNYLNTFNTKKKSVLNYMYKEDKIYPVIDNVDGTVTYSDYILNGIKEYVELKPSYAILNSFLIDDIDSIIDIFNKVNNDNVIESFNKINEIIKNTNEGFFIKETIYKVK